MTLFHHHSVQDKNDRQNGFSLVEVLIALLIFSLISVGSLGSLQSAVQAKEATAAAVARHETVALMRATLRSDFSQMIIRQNRDPYGGRERTVFRGGFNDLLDFTKLGRVNPAGVFVRSDIRRVKYVVEEGQLIRRAFAHENPTPVTTIRDRILLDDIVSSDVSFTVGDVSIQQIELDADADEFDIDYVTLIFRFEDGRELTQIFELEAL